MNSEQIDIPITEDDMGEGFCDPIEERENFKDKQQRELWKIEEKLVKGTNESTTTDSVWNAKEV